MAVDPKWYILHTYSGYENMAKDNLKQVFKKNDMMDKLVDIVIPMEDVVKERNGKRVIVQQRLMPTYVFIKMDYNNDMWHIITNTRGVTGFVGPLGRPLPLTDDEVKRMHLEKPATIVTDFKIGETVKIIDGSLENFIGTIDELDVAQGKCKVTVSMFGRLTPVELELYQIERADVIVED